MGRASESAFFIAKKKKEKKGQRAAKSREETVQIRRCPPRVLDPASLRLVDADPLPLQELKAATVQQQSSAPNRDGETMGEGREGGRRHSQRCSPIRWRPPRLLRRRR